MRIERSYLELQSTHLLVRQGALNSVRVFLPMMPPRIVSGIVMSAHIRMMMTIVPKGSAAVDCSTRM